MPPLIKFANGVDRDRAEILAWIKHRVTSAKLEVTAHRIGLTGGLEAPWLHRLRCNPRFALTVCGDTSPRCILGRIPGDSIIVGSVPALRLGLTRWISYNFGGLQGDNQAGLVETGPAGLPGEPWDYLLFWKFRTRLDRNLSGNY